MSKENVYYLVARNRLTNDLEMIPVQGKRGCSLEEIDLYTTAFEDSFHLERDLNEKGFPISFSDFFIVNQGCLYGEKYLQKQEVLYSYHNVVREIAKDSLHHDIEHSSECIDRILDSFAYKMFMNSSLHEQVISGETNIYPKYVKYFYIRPRFHSSIKYRDGGWARTSYPLIRNIVEAASRKTNRYDWYSNFMYRDLLDSSLFEMTDSSYDPDQLLFFTSDEAQEKQRKIISVMQTFEKLSIDTFIVEEERCVYNPLTFSEYEEGDLEKFQTYLPEELFSLLRILFVQRYFLEISSEKMIGRYQRSVKNRLNQIVSYLQNNPEMLEKVSAWCQLYETYNEKAMGKDGREYQKRRES